MEPTPDIPAALSAKFPLSDPVFVTKTALADVWKIQIGAGRFAALKIYIKPDMGNETCGVRYLQSQNGDGAANLLWSNKNVVLVEWLDGPSLGDLTRAGQDETAGRELVAVANQLHANPPTDAAGYPRLDRWFAALFQLTFSENCPNTTRRDMLRCTRLASDLLATEHDIRPLHGDLHHDNIRMGARGFCAFDAKGVLGERCYELANAFRNPKGANQILRDPARISRLADLWSHCFDVDRRRLLHWACVKCALSIAWRAGPVLINDPETDLLALLLNSLEQPG